MSGTAYIPREYFNRQYDCYDMDKFLNDYKDEIKEVSFGLYLWNLDLGEIKFRYIHPNEKFYVHTNGTGQLHGNEDCIIVVGDYNGVSGSFDLVKNTYPFVYVSNIKSLNGGGFSFKETDFKKEYNELNNRNKEFFSEEKLKWYRSEGKKYIREFNECMAKFDIDSLEILLRSYKERKEIGDAYFVTINEERINLFYKEPFNKIIGSENKVAQILYSECMNGTFPISHYVCDINGWEVGNGHPYLTERMLEKHINSRK